MKLGLQAAENHPEAKDVTLGFKMVDEQLQKSLSEQGLEELVPDGEAFDPNLHECIAQQTSDEIKEDHVIETVRWLPSQRSPHPRGQRNRIKWPFKGEN